MTVLDYNRIYNAIIDRGKSRALNGYSESHHIVPNHNKRRGDKYTDEGRKKQSDRMKAQNPTHGVKPWCHNKATDYTRSIWLEADILYTLWLANGHPSYSRLYNLHTGAPQRGRPGVISPYMNVYKYFKAGWIPTEDVEWTAFKEQVSEQYKPI